MGGTQGAGALPQSQLSCGGRDQLLRPFQSGLQEPETPIVIFIDEPCETRQSVLSIRRAEPVSSQRVEKFLFAHPPGMDVPQREQRYVAPTRAAHMEVDTLVYLLDDRVLPLRQTIYEFSHPLLIKRVAPEDICGKASRTMTLVSDACDLPELVLAKHAAQMRDQGPARGTNNIDAMMDAVAEIGYPVTAETLDRLPGAARRA